MKPDNPVPRHLSQSPTWETAPLRLATSLTHLLESHRKLLIADAGHAVHTHWDFQTLHIISGALGTCKASHKEFSRNKRVTLHTNVCHKVDSMCLNTICMRVLARKRLGSQTRPRKPVPVPTLQSWVAFGRRARSDPPRAETTTQIFTVAGTSEIERDDVWKTNQPLWGSLAS